MERSEARIKTIDLLLEDQNSNADFYASLEVTYLIFSEEKPNGTVWLDTIISTYQPSARTSTNFNGINGALNEYVRGIEAGEYKNGNKQIICHGHTHGTSPVSDIFSFGDLISYVEFNNLHPLFKNMQIRKKVCSLGIKV